VAQQLANGFHSLSALGFEPPRAATSRTPHLFFFFPTSTEETDLSSTMPQVPVAPEGSLAAAVGAPGFACVPGKDVTEKVVDAARAASLTEDRGTRNELERASAKYVQELRLAPAVASAVANLKAGMDQVTQSGAQLKAACLTALYLGVFVALAPVAANLGLSQVAILCALATSTDSDVLTSTDSGFLTSDAGIMDLKLFKLLGVVFQTIPSHAPDRLAQSEAHHQCDDDEAGPPHQELPEFGRARSLPADLRATADANRHGAPAQCHTKASPRQGLYIPDVHTDPPGAVWAELSRLHHLAGDQRRSTRTRRQWHGPDRVPNEAPAE
jgi:hypothetical protein